MTPTQHNSRLLILFLMPLLAARCLDNGTPLDPGVASISGSWVWQRSTGGFAPHVILPPPGSMTVDTFSPRGDYARVKDGILVLTARFAIKTQEPHLMVQYSNVNSGSQYPVVHLFDQWAAVEGDTLRLVDDGADLYAHTYARVK